MCVFCVIETMDRSDCQCTENKWKRQQRDIVSNKKTQTVLVRSSPYSLGLRLRSSFSGGLVWLCLIAEKLHSKDSIWVLLKQILLGRVVLGFPEPLRVHILFFFLPALWPLVYSGKSQMWCSVQKDSSMGRLESSSSLVLDATCGQLGALSPLLGFIVLCVQSSSRVHYSLSLLVVWTPLQIPFFRLSLFMALTMWSLCLFGSSPIRADSPSATALGVPCSASVWMLGKCHVSPSN